jgi:cyclophilin family peptidyl-prolyl cis-trans isomerase
MEVHPDWAPLGAARMKELVGQDFFSEIRFFRVIQNFMAQFGISGNPAVAAKWRNEKMQDDPVKESNKRVMFHSEFPYTVDKYTLARTRTHAQMREDEREAQKG